MLDSLVRVSRRVIEEHFVNIPNVQMGQFRHNYRISTLQADVLIHNHGSTNYLAEAYVLLPQSSAPYATRSYNRWPREVSLPSPCLSPARTKLMLTRSLIKYTRRTPYAQYSRTYISRYPTRECEARWIISKQSLLIYGSLGTASSTFHLLFKVLFTFRSHYFFAIGLPGIFSFRWDLPPI